MTETTVVKVPLNRPQENVIQNFPNQPQLYLEFLENSEKVIPQLRSVPYEPTSFNNYVISNDRKSREPLNDRQSNNIFNRHIHNDFDQEYSDEEDDYEESENGHEEDSDKDSDGDLVSEDGSNQDIADKLRTLQESDDDNTGEKSDDEEGFDRGEMSDDDGNSIMSFGEKQQHTKRRNHQMPPTYDELNSRSNNNGVEDVSYSGKKALSENDRKREMLFKFEMMRKMYKNDGIPRFSMHSSVDEMEAEYDHWMRTLTIDSNINSYKTYLITGFGLMEQILTRVFNFDANGYTKQQIIVMDQYERLLIEIGRDNYTPESKKFSAYVRLLGLIAFNTATFVVTKMIFQNTGTNILSMSNSAARTVNSNLDTSNLGGTSGPSPVTKTMNGPTINLDDI